MEFPSEHSRLFGFIDARVWSEASTTTLSTIGGLISKFPSCHSYFSKF